MKLITHISLVPTLRICGTPLFVQYTSSSCAVYSIGVMCKKLCSMYSEPRILPTQTVHFPHNSQNKYCFFPLNNIHLLVFHVGRSVYRAVSIEFYNIEISSFKEWTMSDFLLHFSKSYLSGFEFWKPKTNIISARVDMLFLLGMILKSGIFYKMIRQHA